MAESQRKAPDREKVIRGLECCVRWTEDALWDEVRCSQCPYDSTEIGCGHRLTADALALLREQETHLVHRYSGPGVYADLWLYCEVCGGKVDDDSNPKFCPNCGRKVK